MPDGARVQVSTEVTWKDYQRITRQMHTHMERFGGLGYLNRRELDDLITNLESIASMANEELDAKTGARS